VPKTSKRASVNKSLGGFSDHMQCCSARTFKEGGCKIVLPGPIGTSICLSGTAYQSKHGFKDKLCDFLIAWERNAGECLSSVLELKGGDFGVSEVHRQLQDGADIVADILKGIDVKFLPVLVHQRMPTVAQRQLPRYKISFRGKRYGIILVKRDCRIVDLRW
jgi:hypothetical protein